MKKHFLFVMLLCALSIVGFINTSCSGQSESKDDKENVDKEKGDSKDQDLYVSKDGKFEVAFPGEPELSNEMVPTDVGDIEMFMFLVEKSATEAFMVAYGDYPSALVEGQDAIELLKGARDGALEGSSIESNKETTVNGWPAILSKAVSSDGLYFVFECVLAKNRLYQIMMVRDGSFPSESSVDSFIGSFKIKMDK